MTDKDFEWFDTSTRAGRPVRQVVGRTTTACPGRTATTDRPRTSTTCTRTGADLHGPCLVRRTWWSTRSTASGGPTATRCAVDRRRGVPPDVSGPQHPEHGKLIGAVSGRPCTTVGTGPTWSATWASSATTARRLVAQPHLDLDPKKMWTLDHLFVGWDPCRARTSCSTRCRMPSAAPRGRLQPGRARRPSGPAPR